jgi:hypothetical protein
VRPAARAAELAQLPRLYTAASLCGFTGRPEAAVGYAEAAVALGIDPRYDPFDPGWSRYREGVANVVAGRWDRDLEICEALAAGSGSGQVMGRCGLLYALQMAGRADEAMAIAEDTLAAARAHGNPFFVAMALLCSGLAFAQADPARALTLLREGLVYSQEHRLRLFEANISGAAAALEAQHGDLGRALALQDTALDMFRGSGNVASAAMNFAYLAVSFDRFDQPDVAATLYGASTKQALGLYVVDLPPVVDHLRAALGDAAFDRCAATGAAMDLADAVKYARHHIELARRQSANPDSGRT